MKPKVKTIDKVIQERQWTKWLLNDRDEKPDRKREAGRYRMGRGGLVRIVRGMRGNHD
jgi:hypothetical protein